MPATKQSSVTITLILFFPLLTFAQWKPLKVGDQIPSIKFSNVINYPTNQLKFSDFRGKLVILEFWGIHCISCLKEFPFIDSLQRQYRDQVQIILINKETKEITERFFATHPNVKQPHIPIVTGNSALYKLFPSSTVALNVWIDKSGAVSFITESLETTFDHINRYLQGQQIQLAAFKGPVIYHQSIFDESRLKQLEYYSYISRWDHDNLTGNGGENVVTLGFDHSSAVELYIKAFNERTKYNFSRPGKLQLILKDSFPYLRPVNSPKMMKWLDNYCYNYLLMIPVKRKGSEYKIMQQDLQRFFDLQPTIEKRSLKGLVLIRSSTADKLKSKGGSPKWNLPIVDFRSTTLDSIRYIRNQPFSKLADAITGYIESNLGIPVNDETGYVGNIDIEMAGKALDEVSQLKSASITDLRKELNKYDLDLVDRNFNAEVLVLKQKE
jgi:thiol-disulfide isomerase/thioredoxin